MENWSCIIITCPTASSAIAAEREVDIFKKKGRLSSSVPVLTVEDPGENIGSGAATLNALLVATEYLSAQRNYSVISYDVLSEARILILHNGRNHIYSCCEKAFITLPLEWSPSTTESRSYASGIMTNLESLFLLIEKLSFGSPSGIWVCSTDMMVLHTKEKLSIDWENTEDVAMFCISSDIKYATGHGVIDIDTQGFVSDIYYCGTLDQVEKLSQGDNKVPLVSGIVFLKTHVAESLLSLHMLSPLDSCTYLGLDSGVNPIQVSLFFDILVAMASNMTKESFILGKCGKTYNLKAGINEGNSKENISARLLVWSELSKYKMTPKFLKGHQHLYWSSQDVAANHMSNLFAISQSDKVHFFNEAPSKLTTSNCLLVNSDIRALNHCQISSGSIICDSVLETQSLFVGENCYISGILMMDSHAVLHIPANFVVLNFYLRTVIGPCITVVFGVNENLNEPISVNKSTFCNKPWRYFLELLNCSNDEIWDSHLEPSDRNLMNARIFPINFSLQDTIQLFNGDIKEPILLERLLSKWKSSDRLSISDIIKDINYSEIFNHRRFVYSKVSSEIVKRTLLHNQEMSLLPYFRTAFIEEWHDTLIRKLDNVLLSDASLVIKTHALSNMADLLSIMAGNTGVLRSGPGSNPAWKVAFTKLLKGDIVEGMESLQSERSLWMDRPDHLMRAARHYERATQILIERSVKTVKEFIILSECSLPEVGVCVTAECPARIDLQGGWSDTPPICYELGGSVVNIAVLVGGKKPIGAQACRTEKPTILLKIKLNEMYHEILIEDMKDILNYDQPNAPGALLKAALICSDIVDIHSERSLCDQLVSKFRGGFEVQTWSLLPQGCGMGTSSILASAVISVLWSASGKKFDNLSVVHAVLYIEQLLTTGGGWQDQVSGVMGGINRAYSEATLPLHVQVEPLHVSEGIINKLNSHLLLIYTGKVRLAKNLLQTVVRNWYARDDTVVKCFKDLITHSLQMKEALENGDLEKVGHLMNLYWEQKKILAPGCEPANVKKIMDLLRPLCYGQLLVGAGGGGFMCILTREENAQDTIKNHLSGLMENSKMEVHTAHIDVTGLSLH